MKSKCMPWDYLCSQALPYLRGGTYSLYFFRRTVAVVCGLFGPFIFCSYLLAKLNVNLETK